MIKTETVAVIEFGDIIHRFCRLTNWSSSHHGEWNADFSKPVFKADLLEQTCQHEQDWLCFYYPNNYDYVTVDPMSLLTYAEKRTYLDKEYHGIGLGAIIRWLVLKGELPDTGEFLVKGW